jgi:hypothetical protein
VQSTHQGADVAVARYRLRTLLRWRVAVEEPQEVGSGIHERHFASRPARFEAGVEERVVRRVELTVQAFDVARLDEDGRTGSAVSVMRGEVQDEIPTGNLQVGRSVTVALLPVDLTAEIVTVEPERRRQIEHTQDGDD